MIKSTFFFFFLQGLGSFFFALPGLGLRSAVIAIGYFFCTCIRSVLSKRTHLILEVWYRKVVLTIDISIIVVGRMPSWQFLR